MSTLRLTERLRSEDGIAAGLAVIALSIMVVLAGTVFTQAVRLSGTSDRDDHGKRAFQAAEAGLNLTIHRLKALQPQKHQCITTSGGSAHVEAPGGSPGWCPKSVTESIGRSQSFQYQVSTAPMPGSCAGLPVGGATERCIVSFGEVRGVKRRVEARVSTMSTRPFPVPGLFGAYGVDLKNSVDVWRDENKSVLGNIGSNGLVRIGNSINYDKIQLGPSAPPPETWNFSSTPFEQTGFVPQNKWEYRDRDWTLPALDPVFAGTQTSNSNASIPPVSGWNAATRTLNLASGTLTLPTGTYNLCSLTIGSATLYAAAGASVKVLIDSPERPGSGCAAGTGGVTLLNNAKFLSSDVNDAQDLLLYIWGSSTIDANVLALANSNEIRAGVFAPKTTVNYVNSAKVHGSLTAGKLILENSTEAKFDGALADIEFPNANHYYRTGWRQCRHEQPVANDPDSGC